MKYFFDNNVAPAIAEVLRVLRQDTSHICECAEHGIARDDTDIAWMPKVAKLGWVAVTIDNNIQRQREEKRVREESGLRVIYLPGALGRKLDFFKQAVVVVRSWESIVEATTDCRAGDCFQVTMHHKVQRMAR